DQGTSFTVNGGTLTAGQHLHITVESNGVANLTGGDGNDVFHFVNSTLGTTDSVAGGGGDDVIQVDEGSTSELGSGIGGIETIEVLADDSSGGTTTQITFVSGFNQNSIVVD